MADRHEGSAGECSGRGGLVLCNRFWLHQVASCARAGKIPAGKLILLVIQIQLLVCALCFRFR